MELLESYPINIVVSWVEGWVVHKICFYIRCGSLLHSSFLYLYLHLCTYVCMKSRGVRMYYIDGLQVGVANYIILLPEGKCARSHVHYRARAATTCIVETPSFQYD